jgi:hypothetical protein
VAEVKAEAAAQEKLLAAVDKQADKEIEKAAAKPVTAIGSFSGSYTGTLRITFPPGGGKVSGTVKTKHGTATVAGSVSKGGVLTADISGPMQYDYYPDGVHAEKRSCSLSASMNGSVRGNAASGSYSGSCAKENDSGSWSARW